MRIFATIIRHLEQLCLAKKYTRNAALAYAVW